MHEPQRTPEALHDMRSQDELTAEEFALEFRRCVYFAVAMIAVVYGVLSIGSGM